MGTTSDFYFVTQPATMRFTNLLPNSLYKEMFRLNVKKELERRMKANKHQVLFVFIGESMYGEADPSSSRRRLTEVTDVRYQVATESKEGKARAQYHMEQKTFIKDVGREMDLGVDTSVTRP